MQALATMSAVAVYATLFGLGGWMAHKPRQFFNGSVSHEPHCDFFTRFTKP